MLVELCFGILAGQSVEIGKEIELRIRLLAATLFRLPTQIVDKNLGMNLLLDIERRRRHNQIGPVLFVLAAPNQLRVQIAVTALVGHSNRCLLVRPHHRLIFSRRNVLARCFVVRQRLDCLRWFFFGHFRHLRSPMLNLSC